MSLHCIYVLPISLLQGRPDLGFPSCEHSSGQACCGLGRPKGYLLGWLLHSAVGIKGLQLVLDATQGIGQLPVIEGHNRLLDPLQQL